MTVERETHTHRHTHTQRERERERERERDPHTPLPRRGRVAPNVSSSARAAVATRRVMAAAWEVKAVRWGDRGGDAVRGREFRRGHGPFVGEGGITLGGDIGWPILARRELDHV